MNPEIAATVVSVLDLNARVLQAALTRSKAAAAQPAAPPRPAFSPEQVKAAADALIANGWVVPEAHGQAVTALSEPGSALNLLINLAEKSAAELRRNRLAVGQAVDQAADRSQVKVAADVGASGVDPWGPSEADEKFLNRMTSVRRA